jgi:hypothetical protein
MGWFMGSGYAILQRDDNVTYPELHHKVTLSHDEYCFATFPEMQIWCRYCHEEGHSKFTCAKAMANILCFDCHNYGHKSVDCPAPQSTRRQETSPKKKRKSQLDTMQDPPANEQSIQTKDIVTPSDSLLRSKHAQPATQVNTQPETPPVETAPSASTMINDEMDEDEEDDHDYVPSTDDETAEYDDYSDEMHSSGDRDLEGLDEEIDDLIKDQTSLSSSQANDLYLHLTTSPSITTRRESNSINAQTSQSSLVDSHQIGTPPPSSN